MPLRLAIGYDGAFLRSLTCPLNKSLFSNLGAALLVIIGLLVEGPWRVYVLNTGLFALSGGITNWLAVHMLFERIPGLYGSGVIQLRFTDFKLAIRNLIMEQFFNQANIEAYFHAAGQSSDKLRQGLSDAIEDINLDQAFESLLDVIMNSSFAGMLGMIGGRDALVKLKEPFIERMRSFFKEQLADREFEATLEQAIRSAMDDETIRARLTELIDRRLEELTPPMVKEIMQRMIREHLGWLVVWGAVFGGSIGLLVTILGNLPVS